jgi:predicted RNase H-like HicB family nuclease
MHRFLIVIEKARGNYSAYSPDLPGCVATGATYEDTEQNMYGAIEMHRIPLITPPNLQLILSINSVVIVTSNHWVNKCQQIWMRAYRVL